MLLFVAVSPDQSAMSRKGSAPSPRCLGVFKMEGVDPIREKPRTIEPRRRGESTGKESRKKSGGKATTRKTNPRKIPKRPKPEII